MKKFSKTFPPPPPKKKQLNTSSHLLSNKLWKNRIADYLRKTGSAKSHTSNRNFHWQQFREDSVFVLKLEYTIGVETVVQSA